MNPLLTLSATKLAAMIRNGEVSSVEVVETHLRRVQSVNPTLNAVVKERFAQAREEAKSADAELKKKGKENLPPFHGVPCTIKECFAFTGMPNSSGLVSRKNVVAEENATAVSRLLKAGLIPMGVTNVPELCMWMETDNRVYGRTNNPYNPDHIVGGSSGGEGSIIGSGGSPCGLGSDIGGSIRMPSFFNGVFGHKPTGGLVPATGQYPTAHGDALRYLTTGPIARQAEDLWPLLNVLAGPDGLDTGCVDWKLKDPSDADISKLDVITVPDNGAVSVSEDLRSAQKRCADFFRSKGARVREVKFEIMKKSFMIWGAMLAAAGGKTYRDLLEDGKKVHALPEIFKRAFGASDFTLPSLILVLLESLQKASPSRQASYVAMGKKLRQEVVEAIGPNGIMLFPSYSSPAPRHHIPLIHPFNWVYTAILNVIEVPVTQVPLGLNSQGLPLGVQAAAVHGNDHLTVAAALALEKEFGGWTPPKNLGLWD